MRKPYDAQPQRKLGPHKDKRPDRLTDSCVDVELDAPGDEMRGAEKPDDPATPLVEEGESIESVAAKEGVESSAKGTCLSAMMRTMGTRPMVMSRCGRRMSTRCDRAMSSKADRSRRMDRIPDPTERVCEAFALSDETDGHVGGLRGPAL